MLRGLAREDLFTVVLEHFQTDTADYADIVLPATTQLEHWDVHLSYGHHYVTLNQPSIEPLGEALPNSEIFRRLAARMGLDHPSLADDDVTLIRQALDSAEPKMRRRDVRRAAGERMDAAQCAEAVSAVCRRRFLTPSGKCEFVSARMAEMGLDPLPSFTPPYEFPETVPELAARYPLTLISSPAHQFLNSTFVNIDSLRAVARESRSACFTRRTPSGAGSRSGRAWSCTTTAARSPPWRASRTPIRPGVVWAPSIWWGKFAADGANANQTTSQRETDMGHGPVFYDNLVEVGLAD